MQIKQLEEQVGLPLVEQIGKTIHVTEAGEEVLRCARLVAESLDELQGVVDRLKGVEAGRLRIAAISTAHYFVPHLLGAFHRRFPGVAVSLDVTNREAVLAELADNAVDMAIMGQPPAEMDLEAAAFLDNPLVIVAPPDHPLAAARGISLKRLEEETFLVREPGSGTRSAMERFFRQHRIRLNTGMEMSSLEAIKQSVQAGLGLGLMPRDAAHLEVALGRLVALDVQDFPIMRRWWLVHRQGKRLTAAAEAFKEFVLGEAAALLNRMGLRG
jgi:DNA-binding transcriptional LysR family regulator